MSAITVINMLTATSFPLVSPVSCLPANTVISKLTATSFLLVLSVSCQLLQPNHLPGFHGYSYPYIFLNIHFVIYIFTPSMAKEFEELVRLQGAAGAEDGEEGGGHALEVAHGGGQ